MEEKVLFLPGAVGLQLEPDLQWGSRVVRFVDGGPWDPGPARACGKIHPGDWITCVEVNGMEATTFPEMMDLLQQAQCSRTLTVRSLARTLLVSSMDSSQSQEATKEVLPMAVSHSNTAPSPNLLATSLPNEDGFMDEGINNDSNVMETPQGMVRDESPGINPTLQNHGHPHHPWNDSLDLTPGWESATPLLLSLHPWNLSLPLEQQPHHAIHLPSHRQRRLSLLPATLPLVFGTTLASAYSISIDPRIRVHLVEKHPLHSPSSHDNTAHSETPRTPTGRRMLGHQILHETISTLQPWASFPGMVSLSSIHPCNTWKHLVHIFGTTLAPNGSFPGDADQVVPIFRSCTMQSQASHFQSKPSKPYMLYPHPLDISLESQPAFQGRIELRQRTGNHHNHTPQQSKVRFSLLCLDQAPSSTMFSMDEKDLLIQKQRQQSFHSTATQDFPMVDQNPTLETYSSTTSTQLENIHQQHEIESTMQEEIANNHIELKIPVTLEEHESSHVALESALARSSSSISTSPSTEPTDKAEPHPKDTSSQPLFEMDNTRAVENACPTAILEQPTTRVVETPTASNNLLRKAKAKHQLSLARLRVKKSYQTRDAQTIDKQEKDKDAKEASNGAKTTNQSIMIADSSEPIAMTAESRDGNVPAAPHSPAIPEGTLPFVPTTPTIDFARFSQEQTLLFEPGPIGLQLDHCTTDGKDSNDYPAKVVRFVDGGPQDPGPARLSGRIQPGDYVIRVEAEGVVGTTYYTILHLLQKSWTTRKLTFRSAWEPLHVATTIVPTTPITPPRPNTLRSMPLKGSAPLPYQWTPLPYDWITRKRPQATTPEEQRAIEHAYREEASRIIQDRDEQKRRALAESQSSLQPESSWNFEDLVLGAVALTAESVAGCLRKQQLHDSDSDDDEDDHQKKD